MSGSYNYYRPSISANAVRRAGQRLEAHLRPFCAKCLTRCEAPGAERSRDWWDYFGHRNSAGDPCDGEWTVPSSSVQPVRLVKP